MTGLRALRGKKKKLVGLWLFAALLFGVFLAGQSEAMPLGLTRTTPDIFSDWISVGYDASNSQFVADGWALQIDTGSSIDLILYDFEITATISNSGQASGGTLEIGSLVSGALLNFGFNTTTPGTLEFVFQVTGGSQFGVGSFVGVILSSDLGDFCTSGFAANFTGGGQSVSDTFPVPEPASLTLVLLGAGSMLAARKQARSAK